MGRLDGKTAIVTGAGPTTIIVGRLSDDRAAIPPGEPVTLDAEEAERLLLLGHVRMRWSHIVGQFGSAVKVYSVA